MNTKILNHLNRNTQYKTRKETDVLFPFGSKFNYTGIVDDMAIFIQENQLKNAPIWKVFVEQFRTDIDTKERLWRGEFFGKMMRGACLTYQYTHDLELYRILEDASKDMLTTQDELGRFSTYSVEGEFNGWDMWARKYVLLGLLHFHEICKSETLRSEIINALEKHLDYIVEHIGESENQKPITETSWNWGAINSCSILEPVMRMYNITGKQSYLDFASYIVKVGGTNMGDVFSMAAEGKLKPHEYPVTKAYEMISGFEGLLEYYRVTKIEKWKTAAINYAKSIMEHDVTVAGSCGCTHELFDNSAVAQTLTSYRGRMQETCVTVTWVKFLNQLLCLTGDICYAEEIEKSVFNALYGAVNTSMNPNNCGLMFDSYSPLLKFRRGMGVGGLMKLNGIHIYGCCAAIGAAGTGAVPQFTLLHSENGIVFNCYAAGEIETVTPADNGLFLEVETEYPSKDDIVIRVNPDEDEEFEIKLRIPAFAKGATLTVNGEEVEATVGTYASITRTWTMGDVIELYLDIEPEIIHALPHPEDEHAKKHIAIKRGALVLTRDADLTDDVGDVLDYDKEIYVKEIHALDVDAQGQYLVSTDKGCATLMIDYASAGKGLTNPHIECWFRTEDYNSPITGEFVEE